MQRKSNLFLEDILNCIKKIKIYAEGMNFQDFLKDEKSIDAITRNFEIIGEAISNLPQDFKDKYKHIPWRTIKDMRNSIVHQYWKIDLEIEWEIIQNKLDILEKQINSILNE
jgi:uncharacterized protein with HEPN domain